MKTVKENIDIFKIYKQTKLKPNFKNEKEIIERSNSRNKSFSKSEKNNLDSNKQILKKKLNENIETIKVNKNFENEKENKILNNCSNDNILASIISLKKYIICQRKNKENADKLINEILDKLESIETEGKIALTSEKNFIQNNDEIILEKKKIEKEKPILSNNDDEFFLNLHSHRKSEIDFLKERILSRKKN